MQVVQPQTLLCWQPPPSGQLKLNFDGAIFYQELKSGVGAVLRDDKGSMIMAMSRLEEGILLVEDVEAIAALRALQFISHLGISHLILEGDSLIVVEAIQSTSIVEFSYSPTIREIKLLLSQFQSYDILHVGRQGNGIAHKMARHARVVENTLQWWFHPSDFIKASLEVDAETSLRA
ncbi:hypothetical protein F2P56_007313 [Juglans regia]|uniref:Uncharacterized protein LOC109013814 n=2 Tax=Juglans regia TaxID=51240 RepID=A0A2I4H5Y8_JUGRE|nr:uncharacterized protein LOC109013814 [Juglans regia]KAF5475513.1 hypothetical protein F2P56_007313 [Juglans regia]